MIFSKPKEIILTEKQYVKIQEAHSSKNIEQIIKENKRFRMKYRENNLKNRT